MRALLGIFALFGATQCSWLSDESESDATPAATSNVRVPDRSLGDPTSLDSDPASEPATLTTPRASIAPRPFTPQQSVPPPSSATVKLPTSLTVEAHFAWPGTEPHLQFPELDADAAKIAAARVRRALQVIVALDGTMAISLRGGAFPLPQGSQLLARPDHLGHLLLWPNQATYRVLPPGSLPALLRERRVDVAPLTVPKVDKDELTKERRVGFRVQRATLNTERGSVTLDRVELPDMPEAGATLCRTLLELASSQPVPAVCGAPWFPVRASYAFKDDSKLEFVVDELTIVTDTPVALAVPPERARFSSRELPEQPKSFLGATALSAISRGDATGALVVRNRGETGAFVLLDNTPVAFVPPKSRPRLEGISKGSYEVLLRDFFGRTLVAAARIEIDPLTVAKIELPAPATDAGAP